MTNREKYANDILDIACSGGNIALVKGKIVDCNDVDNCRDCAFWSTKNGVKKCNESLKMWANKEYTEPKIQPAIEKLHVDDKVLVSKDGKYWRKRHFHHYDPVTDTVYVFNNGGTSWTEGTFYPWDYAKLPDE